MNVCRYMYGNDARGFPIHEASPVMFLRHMDPEIHLYHLTLTRCWPNWLTRRRPVPQPVHAEFGLVQRAESEDLAMVSLI